MVQGIQQILWGREGVWHIFFLFIFSLESLQLEKKQQITRIIFLIFLLKGGEGHPHPSNLITRLAVLAFGRALRDPKEESQLWVSGSFIDL